MLHIKYPKNAARTGSCRVTPIKTLFFIFRQKQKKKRGTTGSARDIPVQRGDPVGAALVQILITFD